MKSIIFSLLAVVIFVASSCGGGHKTCPTYTKAKVKEIKTRI